MHICYLCRYYHRCLLSLQFTLHTVQPKHVNSSPIILHSSSLEKVVSITYAYCSMPANYKTRVFFLYSIEVVFDLCGLKFPTVMYNLYFTIRMCAWSGNMTHIAYIFLHMYMLETVGYLYNRSLCGGSVKEELGWKKKQGGNRSVTYLWEFFETFPHF